MRSMTTRALRTTATGILLSLACMAGTAKSAETYAVVALVGDEIGVTFYYPSVGSNLDRNIQNQVALVDDHFDQLAARVASDSIRKAIPDTASQTVSLTDRAGIANGDDLFASSESLQPLIEAVRPRLTAADTRYLLVVSKYRGDARMQMRSGTTGSGKVSGLGFFVDANKRMRKTSTGETGRGFIAPYAYLMVTLVDLRSGTVVRSGRAVETTTRANVGPESTLDPWTALSAEEKVRILDNMIRLALQRVVPQIVAPG